MRLSELFTPLRRHQSVKSFHRHCGPRGLKAQRSNLSKYGVLFEGCRVAGVFRNDGAYATMTLLHNSDNAIRG